MYCSAGAWSTTVESAGSKRYAESSGSCTVATGEGTVFSFLVHRAPQVPGKELPLVIALLDLDEGVRMVAEVAGVPADGPGGLQIGDRLVVDWNVVDDELTLPIWRRPEESA